MINVPRRYWLKKITALGILALSNSALSNNSEKKSPPQEQDDASETKTSFHYQDHPNGPLHCAQCIYFIPQGENSGQGSCRIIDGNVSANGWCSAFRPK